jgi:leader peptidase (prepilin peptidase) / N-methyltransferase
MSGDRLTSPSDRLTSPSDRPTPGPPAASCRPIVHPLPDCGLSWFGMNLIWAAGGAAAGLLAGAALRATVFRLSVASGDPDRSACSRCGTPAGRRLAVRCGHCGRSLGTPLALELTTAVVLALLLGRFGGQPDMIAFGFFGVLGVALSAIDVAVQRLPDLLTLPAYPILIALLAIAGIASHDLAALGRALLGGLALAASFLLLALLRPGQMGGGDIKLAGLAGLALGWLGWSTLITGAALGFVLSAIVSLALLAARRIKLRSAISFGPFLLGGALVAALISGR